MDMETWVANQRSRLAEPFVSSRLRWNTEAPTNDQLQTQLDSAFQRTDEGDQTEWVVTKRVGRNSRVRVTEDGLEVIRRWPAWVRLLLLTLVAFFPILVQSVLSVIIYLGAAWALTYGVDEEPPVPACTEVVYDNTNGLIGVITLFGLLTCIVWAIGIESRWPALVFYFGLVILVIVLMYLDDGLPLVSPDLNKRVLDIPFSFLTSAAGSLMLFFPLVIVAAAITNLGETLGEYAAGETNRATASVLADMTGGLSTTDPTPEMVRNALIDAFSPIISIIALIAAILAAIWLHGSKSSLDSLRRYRLGTFSSGWQNGISLGVFLMVNAGFYIATAVAFGIIGYGVTGTYYLPERTLSPLVGFLPTDLRVPPREFLAALYTTLDQTAIVIPYVPARVFSVGFLLTVLWPFVFIGFGTVTQIIGRPYRAVWALWQSYQVSAERIQASVDDDIQVRQINRDGYPDLRPFTLLGLWKFVLVSEVLIEECEPDELEALLRHEEYHIRERGPGAVAVLFSLFVGGANAIAAFYDFRESEREADKEAAAAVGRAPLRRAIIRTYDLRARASNNPIPGHTPSAVSPLPTVEGTRMAADVTRTRIEQLSTLLRAYILAPHRLYFGGVLTETAHLRKRERLEMLRSDE